MVFHLAGLPVYSIGSFKGTKLLQVVIPLSALYGVLAHFSMHTHMYIVYCLVDESELG